VALMGSFACLVFDIIPYHDRLCFPGVTWYLALGITYIYAQCDDVLWYSSEPVPCQSTVVTAAARLLSLERDGSRASRCLINLETSQTYF
jgi:hypothetical protein